MLMTNYLGNREGCQCPHNRHRRGLEEIYSWTIKWRMKINFEKTEICLFTKLTNSTDGSQPEVTLQQKKVKYNHTPKLLGVVLDESLNFQTHISKVEQKANKAISTLRQVIYVTYVDCYAIV